MTHNYYTIVNVLFALGTLSICAGLGTSVLKQRIRYPKFLGLLSLLFLFFSIEGFNKAFLAPYYISTYEILSDSFNAALALLLGVSVWPTMHSLLATPTYAELEDAIKHLNYYRRLFDAFMDHSPTLKFIKDSNGNFLYVNKAFENTFKLTRDQVIGHPQSKWLTFDSAQRVRESDMFVLERNSPSSTIDYISCCGVEPQPWLTVKFPIHGLSNDMLIGGISVNISDRLHLAELDSKLAAIVESSQDAIISFDLNGAICSWNNGAEELYGYTSSEALGQHLSMLIESRDTAETNDLLDKITRGVRIEFYETAHTTKTGNLKYVSVSVSPLRNANGRIIGAALIARDISGEKMHKMEINQLNKQLKDRVYELAEQTAALQAARDQALQASNLKTAFCANISHEIRTPLSGILGLNEMILQSPHLSPEEKESTRMVQDSAEALLGVLNDILDISKIEEGKIVFDYIQFNPIEFFKEFRNLLAPSAQQKGIGLALWIDPKMPDALFGDVSHLRQILLAIVGNALKFTEKGSVSIRVDLRTIDAQRALLEVSVKDTGIGIAKEEQRLLFTPFQQLDDSSTKRFGGTGLGLAISKRLLEMMGGDIGVDSDIGRGSTFWFRVPLCRKESCIKELGTDVLANLKLEPITAELSRGRLILVVEDNLILQDLVLRQLSSLGLNSEATVFGREAIELAMSNKFHIILMDINLPDITGLEATEAIRALELSARREPIPIIAMTAGAMRGDREHAVSSGMNDYLAKPIPIEHLKRTLEAWLRKSPIAVQKESKEQPPDQYHAA